MKFEYDHDIISTTDDLKISVADLRDLIQVYALKNEQQALDEMQIILQAILRKNSLGTSAIILSK